MTKPPSASSPAPPAKWASRSSIKRGVGPVAAKTIPITVETLQELLPDACSWAEQQEANILSRGVELIGSQIFDASNAGVTYPAKIRLLRVSSIPAPSDPVLAQAAAEINLITPKTWGMALRYGIFIRADVWGRRDVLVHECVHTAQYERLGGFLPFL
jgi:hypothetical protein